ncbi:hypothetical protein LTR36_001713 [Oleoguttula mirabilis]|uniref:Heterokaryon incompatibility domain-containing protein n=1 Tax=Oleoguttula mirabilis TaxID=1507867 RepID=A0AAV9JPL0_9PEZI|nr:hypothetical protein LTR36_001713 [Oleoguttula mirabilis]
MAALIMNHDSPWATKPLGERDIRVADIEVQDGADAPIRLALKVISLDSALLVQAFVPSHDSKLSYQALSYAWGSREETEEVICDGHAVAVTVNLYAALKRLREKIGQYGVDPTFWADQICIDQDSTDEKSQQVAMMGEIFEKGRRVIVWLGEASEAEGRRLEESLAQRDSLAERREVLLKLSKLEWFGRRWVL